MPLWIVGLLYCHAGTLREKEREKRKNLSLPRTHSIYNPQPPTPNPEPLNAVYIQGHNQGPTQKQDNPYLQGVHSGKCPL